MAKRKMTATVDDETGELDLDQTGTQTMLVDGTEPPPWQTPQQALRAIRDQQTKVDRLEQDHVSAKAEAKNAAAMVEEETSRLRQMLRLVNQMRLFLFFLFIWGASALPGCALVAAAQDPIGPGAPGGWEDLRPREDDFEVLPIESGLAILWDKRTDRGWILAGSAASWQAIEPIGGL